MKSLILVVTIFAFLSRGRGRLTSISNYAEDFADLEFLDEREDCADGACSLYAEKRIIVPEKVVQQRQLVPRSINEPESLGQWRSICGCAGQNQVVDLGEGHYPRLITTARCKSKLSADKFYQCQYYKYRVNVLVKRGVSSIMKNAEEVVELRIPESLHTNWQLFAMTVPVACIPVERS